MSFLDWMNMNMVVDIFCLVFIVALTWKLNKLQKQQQTNKDLLNLTIKNPQQARRQLNKNK